MKLFGRKTAALQSSEGVQQDVESPMAAWFSSLAGRPASDFGGRERIFMEIWRQFCAFRSGVDASELSYFHSTSWWGEWREWPDYVSGTLGGLSSVATKSATKREDRFDVDTLHLVSNYLPAKGTCLTWYDRLKSLGFDYDHGQAAERFGGDYTGNFRMTFFYFVDESIFLNGRRLRTQVDPVEASKSADLKVRHSYVHNVIDLAMEFGEWIHLDDQGKFALTPWRVN
ncbi:hypothetical protein LB515_02240 [Mesorhizobium sp. CA15]|uniref:hypothetical protein n=1 Tax=unclassified Mesorhizobium TaxID=325217 RepID=UPI001CCC936D|nr:MULTISPECIES: hypothetical protein [unclassified Mesorhizobium]MBZ9733899.1 hypothetical protein [Mesorhizobium sp. CA9]MBZ9825573.1 hypothetical protein [Mesorhizobium sp. CA18]MBZ9831997.1 hypothetical protein [Mesorhizobium sp. CA2]MBZ9836997.1 hypothetical protein [Mesorhizobium sp. CA3]MBZ9864186.1 hypothetical protein [Mesorhizobium sp. CA15]